MKEGILPSHESRRLVPGSQDSGAGPSRLDLFAADTDLEGRLAAPRRYRAGFATRSSAQHLLRCKSHSTTSIPPLRDKLTVLPAPTEDECKHLSISAPRPRCGVALKKETHAIIKNTRYLAPVVEEHSAGLSLHAARVPTDQSELNEAYEELFRNNPKVVMTDLLVIEAIEHGQDKDCGIISGKVTQHSDIVEDTPIEEPARRKKVSLKRKTKQIEENKVSTDDFHVVDDSYGYDWKKRFQTKSNQSKNNDEADDKNYGKEMKLDNPAKLEKNCENLSPGEDSEDECVIIDDTKIVGKEFPVTIKKNCDSLSQEEDSEDDCVIIDDITIFEEEKNEVVIAFQADIADCVYYLIDKVCNDLDNCVDILGKQQQQINILKNARNIDNTFNDTCNILKNNKNTLKSGKHTINEQETEGAMTVSLRSKPQNKASKINNLPQKKAKCVIQSKNIEEDNVIKENTNINSPTNTENQLIRKKHKLYSAMYDYNENYEIPRSSKEPSTSTASPMVACYKELENARKSRRRLPRKRASTQPVTSPKTKKYNDIFDKIKDNVVNNEKIALVDRKSENGSCIFNKSSESDDEAIKKKKAQVQKRIRSSSQVRQPVSYTPYYSSENECQKVPKSTVVKQTKPRKVIKTRGTLLTDEKIRKHQVELLETSFEQEKDDANVSEEPEPALRQPVLEAIPDDLIDESRLSVNKPQTLHELERIKIKTKKGLKKKCEKLTNPTLTNRSKEIINNVETDKESATVSPLTGLLVETESRKDVSTFDLDNCVDILRKQQQQIHILKNAQNDNSNSLNDTCNILKNNKNALKSAKHTINEQETESAMIISLRSKPKNQASKMNNSLQKKAKCIVQSKNIEEDNVIKENTNINSPTNTESQLIRKKHKLYSAMDDYNENYEIPRSSKEGRPSTSTDSPIVACYKELENTRKSRIRLPRKRASTQPVTSPKTKKYNDIFEKIKNNVVNNEKITLVDRKSENGSCNFNKSSESDDEAFKKKKVQVQKRQKVPKPTAVKETKPKKVKKLRGTPLTDEKIRNHQVEVLETSFVHEKDDANVSEEPEPALQQPVLEAIPDDLIDESRLSANKPQTLHKLEIIKIKTETGLKKKYVKLTKPIITNRSKEIVNNVETDKESATVSPLPGLLVEKELPKDELTSSFDTNMLQKLKKIYIDGDDLSTTRDTNNLLVNNNNNNDGLEVDILSETGDHQSAINMGNYIDNAPEDLQTVDMSDVASEKSIATCGPSPITGHNNSDESPPNLEALFEKFEHRDLDDEGTIRYSRVLNIISPGKIDRTQKSSTTGTIVLDRISSDEINKWLPMPRTTEVIEEHKNTRKLSMRRKSVSKPCITCENYNTKISPVIFNFDSVTGTRITRSRTRSIKNIKSRTIVEKLRTETVESTYDKENNEQGVGSKAAVKSAETQETVESSVDPVKLSRSLTSVQSCLKRNAAASTQIDNNKGKAAKEMLHEGMERLNTRLVELREIVEAMQAASRNEHEDVSSVIQEFERMMTSFATSNGALQTTFATSMAALLKSQLDRLTF